MRRETARGSVCCCVRRLRAHLKLARHNTQGDYKYVVLIFHMRADSSQLICIIYNYGTGCYWHPNVIDVCTQKTTGRENNVINEEYYCFVPMDDQRIHCNLS